METIGLSILSVACILWMTYNTHMMRKQLSGTTKALPAAPATVTAVFHPDHGLIRVFENHSLSVHYNHRGWWYECSCGHKRHAHNVNEKVMGTEKTAIETWRTHSALYAELDHDVTQSELGRTQTEERDYIEKYRAACYCKSANDEIILLEQQRPKSLDRL